MTSRSRTVVATTTWNTGALVDDFLDHYRRLGAAAVLLMDFGSVEAIIPSASTGTRRGM